MQKGFGQKACQMSNRATIYWIHLPEHTNIFTEGYIGVSKNYKHRFLQHKRNKSKRHENPHLMYALKKYDNITVSPLLEGETDYCYEIEEKLRPNIKIGWNLAKGGSQPPSQQGKISWNKGKKASEETKEKCQKAKIGTHLSEETRQKISKIKKIQCLGSNNPNFGKKASEETRKKMSNSRKGKIKSEQWKQKIRDSVKKTKQLKKASV